MFHDPQRRWLLWLLVIVFGGGALAVVILLPKWDTPPIASEEFGPADIAMNTFTPVNADIDPLNLLDFPVPDPVEDAGVTAGERYENVEALADLDAAQFLRLQYAITEWVAPDDGCGHCHVAEPGRADTAAFDEGYDWADPSLYTFTVARRMIEMTREMNARWPEHLMPQGATCFSCHRGRNVPEYVWFKAGDYPPPEERWFQRPPPWIRTAHTIRDFFPREAFELFLLEDNRAAGLQAREVSVETMASPVDRIGDFTWGENIYLFMMQQSDALGVNCTFCHNSRAFWDWKQSTPYRITGWYAQDNTQVINHDFIEPLADVFPPERLGPVGDPAKANCMTCHISERKPLGGVPMVEHFPGLIAPQSGD